MNRNKLSFCGPVETCDCPRHVGECRWFKCGQPGPQEHAYKCEVFYATAGNFSEQPARLRNIGLVVAHVLGYTGGAAHVFGSCGKLWTLAALHYRLRDGALSSSMALLLIPRPVPVSLVPTIQKLGKSEKLYRPRSHRFFDTNPFRGLGAGHNGIERKLTLSHVAVAVWSAHASWVARASLGGRVNWEMWQLDHIAPAPARLLGEDEKPPIPAKMKKSYSSSMLKEVPRTTGPRLVVVNHCSTPSHVTDISDTSSSPGVVTPPLQSLSPSPSRPRSFAGFAGWDLPSTPPSTLPQGLASKQQRFSCTALHDIANGGDLPSSSRPLPQHPRHSPSRWSLPRGSPSHSIMVLRDDDESTYYLANESLINEDMESIRRAPFRNSPLRA